MPLVISSSSLFYLDISIDVSAPMFIVYLVCHFLLESRWTSDRLGLVQYDPSSTQTISFFELNSFTFNKFIDKTFASILVFLNDESSPYRRELEGGAVEWPWS